jgi:prephenate dehydrogenase
MKHQDAPGTTFKRHLKIARGVLGEDDTLLREILFNPHTKPKVEGIRTELKTLLQIIDNRDEEAMTAYLTRIRKNIEN